MFVCGRFPYAWQSERATTSLLSQIQHMDEDIEVKNQVVADLERTVAILQLDVQNLRSSCDGLVSGRAPPRHLEAGGAVLFSPIVAAKSLEGGQT